MLFKRGCPINVGRKLSLRDGRLSAALLRLSRCDNQEFGAYTIYDFPMSQEKMENGGSVYIGGGLYRVDILWAGCMYPDGSRAFSGRKEDL